MRHGISAAAAIAGLALVGSLAFACATPFAAIGTVAAADTGLLEGLSLVTLAWLSNQAIGFMVLGYPMSVDAFAWGTAIGLASLMAFFASRTVLTLAGRHPLGLAIAFLSSFAGYELALYTSSVALGAADDAFSFLTVARILAINAATFVGAQLLIRGFKRVSSFRSIGRPVSSAS